MKELILTVVSIPVSMASLSLILLYPIYGITLAIMFTCFINVVVRER